MADAISIVIKGEAGSAVKALRETEQGTRDAAKAAQESGGHFAGLGDHVEGLKSHLGMLTTALAGVAGGFTAAFEIKSALGRASEITGEVAKLKREMGGTAEEASKLRFQFEETGVGFEAGEKGLRKFEKALAGITDMEDGVAIPSGKAMVANLKALGIEAEDASGKQRPLNDVIGDLAEKFHNMPDGVEKTALATSLFGKSGADLLPFLNRGKDGLADLGKEAGKLGLVLDQGMLDTMKKNKEASREFHAALDGIQLQIGTALMPIVTDFAIKVTELAIAFNQRAVPAIKEAAKWVHDELIPAMQDFAHNDVMPMVRDLGHIIMDTVVPALQSFANWIGDKLAGPMKSLFDALGGKEAMLKTLAIVIAGVLVAAFGAWAIAAGAAAVATLAAAAPVIAIGLAIGLLAAGIIQLVQHWDDLTAKYPPLKTATDDVKAAFSGFVDWIKDPFIPVIKSIGDKVQEAVIAATGFVKDHWHEIQDIAKPVIDQVIAYVTSVTDSLKAIISFFKDVFHGDWDAAWKDVKDLFKAQWQLVLDTLSNLKAFLEALWPIIKEAGSAFLQKLWDGLKATWDLAKAWVETLPGLILTALGDLTKLLEAAGKAILQGLWDGAKAVWELTKTWIASLPGLVVSTLGALGELLKATGKAILQGLWDGAKLIWTDTVAWVASLPQVTIDTLGDLSSLLKTVGNAILQGLWDGATAIWTNVVTWIASLPGLVVSTLGDLTTLLTDKGRTVLGSMLNGLTGFWDDTALPWVKGLPGLVVSGIGDVLETLKDVGWDLIRGLIKGMTDAATSLIPDAAGAVVGGAKGAFKKVAGIFSPSTVFADEVGAPIGQGIVKGMLSTLPAIAGAAAALAVAASGAAAGTYAATESGAAEIMRIHDIYMYGTPEQQAAETARANAAIAAYHAATTTGPVQHYATGGIVTRPTLALIGEAGPEAVVPLSRGGGAGSGITIQFNAPVYGMLDFETRVKSIVRDAARGGAFRGLVG